VGCAAVLVGSGGVLVCACEFWWVLVGFLWVLVGFLWVLVGSGAVLVSSFGFL
jgi:hypothetical protein